jgi:hypothetical protein
MSGAPCTSDALAMHSPRRCRRRRPTRASRDRNRPLDWGQRHRPAPRAAWVRPGRRIAVRCSISTPEADFRSMQLGLTDSMPSTVSTRELMMRRSRHDMTDAIVGFREGVGSARAVSNRDVRLGRSSPVCVPPLTRLVPPRPAGTPLARPGSLNPHLRGPGPPSRGMQSAPRC